MLEKDVVELARERRAFIVDLLKEFGPMTARNIAKKMSLAEFHGHSYWAAPQISTYLIRLQKLGLIYSFNPANCRPRIYAVNELFNGPGVA